MDKKDYFVLVGALVFALILIFIYTFYYSNTQEKESSLGIFEDVISLFTLNAESVSDRIYSATSPDGVCGYENYKVNFLGYGEVCYVNYAYGAKLIYGTRGIEFGKIGGGSWDPVLKYRLPVNHQQTKIDYTYPDSGKLCGACMECKIIPESAKLKERWDNGDRSFSNGQIIDLRTCQWKEDGSTHYNMCDENCDEREELPLELSAKCVKKDKNNRESKELICERSGCMFYSECGICELCDRKAGLKRGTCIPYNDWEYDVYYHNSFENSFSGEDKKNLMVFNLFPPPAKVLSGPGCIKEYYNGVKAVKDGLYGSLSLVPLNDKGYVCINGTCMGGLRVLEGEACRKDSTYIGGDSCQKCMDCVNGKCQAIDGGTDIGMCDEKNNLGGVVESGVEYICKKSKILNNNKIYCIDKNKAGDL